MGGGGRGSGRKRIQPRKGRAYPGSAGLGLTTFNSLKAGLDLVIICLFRTAGLNTQCLYGNLYQKSL